MSWVDNAFGVSPSALTFRSQRSAVLANNISNSDTPGFKAQDYNFQDALKSQTLGKALPMKATQAGHSQASNVDQFGGVQYRVPTKASSNGNTVESEVEQAAFAENALRYQTSLQFLSGTISGLRLAIKGQ